MLVGYARVSTRDQSPALQLNALREVGCEKVFTEKASGACACAAVAIERASRQIGTRIMGMARAPLQDVPPTFQYGKRWR